DANRIGKAVVQRAMETVGGDGRGDGDTGNLGERVHAGIRATGALGQNALARDAMDGVSQRALYGSEAGLNLPAVIRRAVVREREFEVRHVPGCKVLGTRY